MSTGPFVAMAVVCRRVDRQPDGSIDVIGVVDGFELERDTTTETDVPAVVSLIMLVSLRAGSCRGWREISVRGHYPSGASGAAVSRRVEFTDDRPAATITVPLELEIDAPGTYLFDVTYEERVLTRVELHVRRNAG